VTISLLAGLLPGVIYRFPGGLMNTSAAYRRGRAVTEGFQDGGGECLAFWAEREMGWRTAKSQQRLDHGHGAGRHRGVDRVVTPTVPTSHHSDLRAPWQGGVPSEDDATRLLERGPAYCRLTGRPCKFDATWASSRLSAVQRPVTEAARTVQPFSMGDPLLLSFNWD
jgi:hypothetical protein